jgi:hypothetical protein
MARFSAAEVAHRLEIDDLYARYCHHADSSDIQALDEVFAADARLDYTADGAPDVEPYAIARDGDVFRGRIFWRVAHHYTNLLIRFDDDHASARVTMKVWCLAATAEEAGSPVAVLIGTYDDVLVNQPGGWRIQHRVWKPGWVGAGQTVQGPFSVGSAS